MKGRYTLYPDRGYLVFEVEGTVTLKEVQAFFQRILSDPEWSPGYNGLGDYTNARFELTASEVEELAHFFKATMRESPALSANVVDSKANYGMVRMFDALSDEMLNIRLFYDRSEAETWIRAHSAPLSTSREDD